MSAADRLMCLGGCGYALTTRLARSRGYGHRCWDKLPAATQAAITAEIRPPRPPAKPRVVRVRSAAAPDASQLQLTGPHACPRCGQPTTNDPSFLCDACEDQDARDQEGMDATFEHDPDLGKDLDWD